ncbi:monovalent cation/H(+) antiporter subunit G [uncultured Neptuniibacter sp.]|uniref:monovalent cation/H(+) antiporter subunit G n=1 Tax=uncultured Neptuniibacter sp. TaxID=502143 RepID=UPI002626CEC7|nr:monovalent cation/H(+) antiporter subunit G [uncultured Neptuniibacter sp.]
MEILINLLSTLCFLVGGFLCLTGGIGLLRLPDFFSRVHAAGVTETLATPVLILGILIHQPELSLDSIKLVLIMLIVLATNPTASHAMAKAALHGGQRPVIFDQPKDNNDAPSRGGDLSKP